MSLPPRKWLVAGAALIVCGLVAGSATASLVPACQEAPQHVTQSPTGAIDGCIRVGALGSGRYIISLQTNLEDDQAVVRKLSPGGFERGPDGPPVKVSLSPDAGPPGTVVTVTGDVSRPISAAGRASFAKGLGDFTWDGFPSGLMLLGKQVHWRSADSFTARVTVPAAPWVQGGNPPRVVGWRSGRYALSVHCVTSPGGCAEAAPEGSAEFRLEVERPPRWCVNGDSCATLRATPAHAAPNSTVRISGYAPIVGFDFGEQNQFLGSIQITPGRRHEAVRFTTSRRGQTLATFGAAPFAVRASPSFVSLGRVTPLFEVTDGQRPIAADPTDPRIVAWCDGARGLTLSVDGARVTVPTKTVAAPLHAVSAYRVGRRYICTDVLPLSRSTVVAAFAGETGPETGIFANYPAETRNDGRTWTALPVPPDSTSAGFGGFRSSGRAAVAVFVRRVKTRNGPSLDATSPVVETSSDGGTVWTPAHLACPPRGPCVTLGPFLPGDCAMGVSTQYVLRSTDGGRNWRSSPTLTPAQFACGEGTLVGIKRASALLVDALSTYPIQRTTDAGASWGNVSVPLPNDLSQAISSGGLNDFGPGGITVLPNGGLLLSGGDPSTGGWKLLRPGARRWCDVSGYARAWQLAVQASSITVIGGNLWWLTYGAPTGNHPAPLRVHKLPLSAVRCA